jgi:hypothetical protein
VSPVTVTLTPITEPTLSIVTLQSSRHPPLSVTCVHMHMCESVFCDRCWRMSYSSCVCAQMLRCFIDGTWLLWLGLRDTQVSALFENLNCSVQWRAPCVILRLFVVSRC